MKLEITDLNYHYNQNKGINDLELLLKPGQFVGIIGPNGSGKSTLLKQIYRSLVPDRGTIWLDELELEKMSYRQSAQLMGVVPQESEVPFDFTVKEILLMGRGPHKKLFAKDNQQDYDLVFEALAKVGLESHSQAIYNNLSGGEKQRVLLARALVQQARLLVLDEPTNHLDIYYQLTLLKLVKDLKISVLAAIHDLNLATLYCDYIYVMDQGGIVAKGAPDQVITPELIKEVFRVEVEIMTDSTSGQRHLRYLPL